jgi:peptide/nickel transport system ATP-binding protein/oligopeptide transport system ATP-binding protein
MRAHKMGTRSERFARADELLEVVGLSREHGNRFPHEFSGGQRQRIGIARALALNPEFIVCDEPTSALDVSIQAQVITLLKDLQRRLKLTYLFISHDLAMVKYVSDRIVVMYLGEIVEIAPSDRLYEFPLHPYTRSLISSIQVADPIVEAGRRRIRLTGDIPNPMDVAGVGCKFFSRCPSARPECAAAKPELREVAPGHFASCTVGAPEGGLTV